ncbi:DBH-like monooxygenase protein 1 homolog isoform X2 [Sinocyclocheilus grahami]|uniref:DBH-like monooxygenase protein 1 homolog isoform X2 n=1 Tax=Sinocyclocheilus grahami TaxID=75366 RepID=UPI0007AD5B20|nr:PREDICTED: DBH-like monooxygenase protein 1 homolog isoform X2 [Sinocyclocheilus grahami]
MSENQPLYALVFLTSLFSSTCSQGTRFVHSAALDADGRYSIKWGFDESTITFEVEVETRGYIGFGLSPTGAMSSSDIVIGGVLDGSPYLLDYYTDSNRKVHKDVLQSYQLLYGRENDTHTVLAFSRNLQTCDDNDKVITGSTVRVIWAFHAEDVGVSGPVYHGTNRGRKSLRLLNPGTSSSIPAGTAFFDLQNEEIEPMIQKGHGNLVHHILLYQCDSNLNKSEINRGHECYHPNMPDSFFTCETVLFAWAIGGEGFTYPPHAGMSIGTSIDPVYVQMEIHFDNPSLQRGIVDSSGLRLYYSPSLRRYDAGVIETGVWVSLYHMLPPGMQDYITEGHCTQECLQESLDSEMPSGIHVFAVLLHAHLAGRAIRARHFRQQVELQPLASDDQFDFNFQEFQPLSQERIILPGDSLITECRYNTKGRMNMTWGGLSTRDEMCLSYLLYYPRVNLARCESLPEITGQLKFIGIKEIQEPVITWPFVIKSPKKYSNLSFTEAMDKYKWTRKRGKAFNNIVRKLPMNVRCSKIGQDEWSIQGMIISPPELKSEQTSAAVVACRNVSEIQCGCSFVLLLTACLLLILQTCLYL